MNATIFIDQAIRHFQTEAPRRASSKSGSGPKPPAAETETADPTDILVPMDFSPAAMQSLQTAIRFAQKHGSRITVLHVVDVNLCPTYRVDTTKIERDLIADAEQNLARLIAPLTASAQFATKIVKGRPFDQILKVARDQGIKLIVMGQKRSRGFWSFLHRHTARHVIERAACSVILVAEETKKPAHRQPSSNTQSVTA